MYRGKVIAGARYNIYKLIGIHVALHFYLYSFNGGKIQVNFMFSLRSLHIFMKVIIICNNDPMLKGYTNQFRVSVLQSVVGIVVFWETAIYVIGADILSCIQY